MCTSRVGSSFSGNFYISLVNSNQNMGISTHLFDLSLLVKVLPPNLLNLLALRYVREAFKISSSQHNNGKWQSSS